MTEIFVEESARISDGWRALVKNNDQTIGVVKANGKVHAFLNICPHQGGPVCEGMVVHRVEEIIAADKTYQGMRFSEDDVHMVCPWHGWEFNIETGRCAGDGKHALKRFETVERDGRVYVVV